MTNLEQEMDHRRGGCGRFVIEGRRSGPIRRQEWYLSIVPSTGNCWVAL